MRAVKIRASLVRCGTCGKPKRLGERHVCITRLDRKPRTGKTTVAPKLRLSYGKCGTCHKEITGWPHTCTVRTDFAKRKAEQEKAAARKRRRRDEHPPASECTDEDCPRYPCVQARVAWARGYQEGLAAGHAAGHAEGFAEGHAAGYAAGQSAAG